MNIYGGCLYTNCEQKCCDRNGYCPSMMDKKCYYYYDNYKAYNLSALTTQDKIGLGVTIGFFVFMILITIAVVCFKQRRLLMNQNNTRITTVIPRPVSKHHNPELQQNDDTMIQAQKAPPAYSQGIPFDNNQLIWKQGNRLNTDQTIRLNLTQYQ